jgi:glycosyltransferase involved in cell wall biosynthesis
VGEFPKEIENGIHGYIFRSGDADDLAVKIQQFYHELYLTPDLRRHLKHLALKKYSWDSLSRTILEVYQRVQGVGNS